MKKFLISAFTLAVLAISCNIEKNAQPATPKNDDIQITINATLEDTKTYISHDDAGYHAFWSNGDALYVIRDTEYSSRKIFTNSSADGETASFSGSFTGFNPGEHILYAWYPKSITNSNQGDGIYSFSIPATQTLPSLDSFDKAADLLIGKPVHLTLEEGTSEVTTVDMPFRRAACILKVIPEDATSDNLLSGLKVSQIKITSKSEQLAGKIKVTLNGSADDTIGTNSKSVTANYSGNDFLINGNNAAYIIVSPGSLSSQLTIDVTTNSNKYSIKKIVTPESAITLTAGRVKPLRIRLTDDDVTVLETSIIANPESFTNIPAEGQSGTITLSYTNADGWTPGVASYSGCVSSASLDATDKTQLNYTVSAYNASVGTSGEIIVQLTKEGETTVTKRISFTQANPSRVPSKVYVLYSLEQGKFLQNEKANEESVTTSSLFTVSKGSSQASGAKISNYGSPNSTLPFDATTCSASDYTYSFGVKMESATTITFSRPSSDSTVEIYAVGKSSDASQFALTGVSSSVGFVSGRIDTTGELPIDANANSVTIGRGGAEKVVVLVIVREY